MELAASNGLRLVIRLMLDRVTMVPRSRVSQCISQCIGQPAAEDLLRLSRALLVFLGLAR